jgi:hypothetical protein
VTIRSSVDEYWYENSVVFTSDEGHEDVLADRRPASCPPCAVGFFPAPPSSDKAGRGAGCSAASSFTEGYTTKADARAYEPFYYSDRITGAHIDGGIAGALVQQQQ